MQIPAVQIGHPDVERIQPTFHALKRFRERLYEGPPGVDEAIAGLTAVLSVAEITTRPPGGRSGDWSLWAVSGRAVFPLEEGASGTWIAPTCLSVGR